MDQESPPHTGLTALSIPLEGVSEILSGWSGKGSLYEALAAISGDDDGLKRDWDEQAIRARADRILIENVRSDLEEWPRSVEEWLPHLPVRIRSEVRVSATPRGRVMWRDTARRFGWPPQSYVIRRRHREIADVTVTTLAWTVFRLDEMLVSARRRKIVEEDDPTFVLPLEAAKEALKLTETPDTLPRPDRHDLEALTTSGMPWSHVEPVTGKIVRSETDLLWFATQLLAPDPDLRWRLYHLAVLGHTLKALRAEGAKIRWLTPMGAGHPGPNFLATFPDGVKVDVWFEASGAHSYYGTGPSLYKQTVKAVRGTEAAIGADLGLFIPSRSRALLLECKFSWSGSYVGRNGFHQAAGYALDALEQWSTVWSYVVGPVETVMDRTNADVSRAPSAITLGVLSVPRLAGLITDFLDK